MERAELRKSTFSTLEFWKELCESGFTEHSGKLVELSGYCPPSPKSLVGAFFRLSFDFDLLERTPQSTAYRSQQILNLARTSNHAYVPARIYGGSPKWLGQLSGSRR